MTLLISINLWVLMQLLVGPLELPVAQPERTRLQLSITGRSTPGEELMVALLTPLLSMILLLTPGLPELLVALPALIIVPFCITAKSIPGEDGMDRPELIRLISMILLLHPGL